ncbi:hypothetical protein GF376_04935 [Candidatus Peregrinibacteria bacterium]|nr:hypothetical protein [Candidatus Peregrinibacteria bacterium]
MSISPNCDKCQKELNDFGAILLGPPDDENMVIKQHLCVACYDEIVEEFE